MQPYSYFAPDDPRRPVDYVESTTTVVERDREWWPWLALASVALLLVVVGYLALRDDEDDVAPVVQPSPVQSTVVVPPAPAQQPVQAPPAQAPPVVVQQPPAPAVTVRETRTEQVPAPGPTVTVQQQAPPAAQPPAAQQAPATAAPAPARS